ncbi:MAG: GNAT family N-acetyltransferase [Candidatus Melainabacteria bacterium]|nr:GNAT family N-acetyltransferase [Candidatus Melainabacteria bacterium]
MNSPETPSCASSNIASAVVCRPASPEEIPLLIEFVLQMAADSEGRLLDPLIAGEGVQAIFNEPALGTYWVIFHREIHQPVGCCLVTTEWSDWHNAPYWWIQSAYIRPDYRGQGLFHQLMQALESAAKAQDVCSLRLYVHKDNASAIAVYQRQGFSADRYCCMEKPLNR